MVMVANKKSHDQMTEDLNLFLGQHTEKFTTWYLFIDLMCGLFFRLQASLSSLQTASNHCGTEERTETRSEEKRDEKDAEESAGEHSL